MTPRTAPIAVFVTNVLFILLTLACALQFVHAFSILALVGAIYGVGAFITSAAISPTQKERISFRQLQQYPSRQLWNLVRTYWLWPFVMFGIFAWLRSSK
jgi:hypothetical protein